MPTEISFVDGNVIKNVYAADGRKLSSFYLVSVTPNTEPIEKTKEQSTAGKARTVIDNGTHYIGNFEYLLGEKGVFESLRIHNAEGYVENDEYFYFRKDHLGNNREVFNATTQQTVQKNNYYPSGLPFTYETDVVQPYLHGGKEFIEMGYDVYDLGFRTYYPAIARFTSIDPLAERFYSQSPYVYAANNPVRYIDFLGLAATPPPNELTNQNNNEMPNDDIWLGSGGSSFMDGCGYPAYTGFLRIGLYGSEYIRDDGNVFYFRGIKNNPSLLFEYLFKTEYNYVVVDAGGTIIDIIYDDNYQVYVYTGAKGTYDRDKHNPDNMNNLKRIGSMVNSTYDGYEIGQPAFWYPIETGGSNEVSITVRTSKLMYGMKEYYGQEYGETFYGSGFAWNWWHARNHGGYVNMNLPSTGWWAKGTRNWNKILDPIHDALLIMSRLFNINKAAQDIAEETIEEEPVITHDTIDVRDILTTPTTRSNGKVDWSTAGNKAGEQKEVRTRRNGKLESIKTIHIYY